VLDRIEQWRSTREKRTAMPEVLWEAAVAAAREYGTYRTARALRVNFPTLKYRAAVAAGLERAGSSAAAEAGFVELRPHPAIGPGLPDTAIVELSRADGAKITIRLARPEAFDLAGLTRTFWSLSA